MIVDVYDLNRTVSFIDENRSIASCHAKTVDAKILWFEKFCM